MTTETGQVSVEVVLLIPLLVALLGLSVAGGRLWLARSAVASTAASAARAATGARSAEEARQRAGLTVSRNLATNPCSSRVVDVDATGFAKPPGTRASVHVSIACTVHLRDVLVPGLPGSIAVSAEAASPLDTYRER